eukprot:CAMPEP_0206400634 /NCGR_PEP_ID=MMETSP0294-20121207/25673_1 /ASSEMBLY_ACC=CAM_ASM_000327 /TAXON_ID=39354 /ORGANISM="Heterosigma akashiwo, Strain CCMP2393" /LENGTH=71 /DNA_ID=CAMNT_0053856945 /DNA_START=23 /DNA_END=235 /DNA_ORIENTATION=-
MVMMGPGNQMQQQLQPSLGARPNPQLGQQVMLPGPSPSHQGQMLTPQQGQGTLTGPGQQGMMPGPSPSHQG